MKENKRQMAVVSYSYCGYLCKYDLIADSTSVVGVFDSIELAKAAVKDLIKATKEALDKDPETAGNYKFDEEEETQSTYRVDWHVKPAETLDYDYTVICKEVTINPDLTNLRKEKWEWDWDV